MVVTAIQLCEYSKHHPIRHVKRMNGMGDESGAHRAVRKHAFGESCYGPPSALAQVHALMACHSFFRTGNTAKHGALPLGRGQAPLCQSGGTHLLDCSQHGGNLFKTAAALSRQDPSFLPVTLGHMGNEVLPVHRAPPSSRILHIVCPSQGAGRDITRQTFLCLSIRHILWRTAAISSSPKERSPQTVISRPLPKSPRGPMHPTTPGTCSPPRDEVTLQGTGCVYADAREGPLDAGPGPLPHLYLPTRGLASASGDETDPGTWFCRWDPAASRGRGAAPPAAGRP